MLSGKAEDPAGANQRSFSEAVQELLALHARFQDTERGERPQLYAQCIPWLSEVRACTTPPLPVREIIAATREVDWHLRALAGLSTGQAGKDEEHAAWALNGLKALVGCAGPC